jgi:hypothetical protein
MDPSYEIFNTKTRAVVLRGTQAQCLNAAQSWSRNAQPGEFTVRPIFPAGMVVVTKERFWALVKAEQRDIHPRPEADVTRWEGTHTREPWGWASTGYSNSGQETVYAVLASVAG